MLDDLQVAGLVPYSTADWPGKLAAVAFLQGCPWDCFYCHNPGLIDPRGLGESSFDELVALLKKRGGLLDGVVFSGGEPTRQQALIDAIKIVRDMGFLVGLHTGGAYPKRLAEALPLLDWVGLDIKATAENYSFVTGRGPSAQRAWDSLALIQQEAATRETGRGALSYEVRTTVHPESTPPEDLTQLSETLAAAGVNAWALQCFRPDGARGRMPRISDAGASISSEKVHAAVNAAEAAPPYSLRGF